MKRNGKGAENALSVCLSFHRGKSKCQDEQTRTVTFSPSVQAKRRKLGHLNGIGKKELASALPIYSVLGLFPGSPFAPVANSPT